MEPRRVDDHVVPDTFSTRRTLELENSTKFGRGRLYRGLQDPRKWRVRPEPSGKNPGDPLSASVPRDDAE
jgi:hypothetical protein